jgi:Ni/Fe-hydrogenase subunit HybB-like protein
MHSFIYLYSGLEGHSKLVPIMWLSSILAVIALGLLIFPQIRRKEGLLAIASISTFLSLWIDKGFGLIVGGFVPNPFEKITEYWPTLPETLITLAVWAIGFLVLTILYKIAVSIKEDAVYDKYGEKQVQTE